MFRELKEELSLVDIHATPHFADVYIDTDGFSDGTGLIVLNYILDSPTVFSPKIDSEHSEFLWIPWEEFLELKFHNKKVAMKDMIYEIFL